MDSLERKKLRVNYVDLVRNLEPEDILDYLYQERALSEDDCESIRAGTTRAQRMRLFLAILPKKSAGAYSALLASMRRAGYDFLVEQLETTSMDDIETHAQTACDGISTVDTNAHNAILDFKIYELREKLAQQTGVVTSMTQEMKTLQDELKRQSQNFEGNSEKYKRTVTVLGELEQEKEKQKEILDEVYECMLKDMNQLKEDEEKSTVSSTVSTLRHQSSITGSFRMYTRAKCVAVGDGATGKTSIIHYFINKKHLSYYIPTVFDNRALDVPHGDTLVNMQFWDTAGQEDYDRLRPLSYSDSNVALLVFSLTSQGSLNNVIDKWYPEFRHFCPHVPVLLVGNKTDSASDTEQLESLKKYGQRYIEAKEADKAAEVIKAVGNRAFLCSAVSGEGISELLTAVVESSLSHMRKKKKHKKTACCVL